MYKTLLDLRIKYMLLLYSCLFHSHFVERLYCHVMLYKCLEFSMQFELRTETLVFFVTKFSRFSGYNWYSVFLWEFKYFQGKVFLSSLNSFQCKNVFLFDNFCMFNNAILVLETTKDLWVCNFDWLTAIIMCRNMFTDLAIQNKHQKSKAKK